MGSTNLGLGKTDRQGIFKGIKSEGARSVSPATCLKLPASNPAPKFAVDWIKSGFTLNIAMGSPGAGSMILLLESLISPQNTLTGYHYLFFLARRAPNTDI
jgi:hypothetical protein